MGDLIHQNVTVIKVVPALASFATPYSSGDVLGALNTISGAVLSGKGACVVDSIVVLDDANQKSSVDLIFFDSAPVNTVGADNAAYALNDADLDKVLGRISVLNTDYVSSSTTNAEATLRNQGLLLEAAAGSTTLYILAVSRGTPTYGNAGSLRIKIGLRDY